jgi:hypothetical protein
VLGHERDGMVDVPGLQHADPPKCSLVG